MTTTVTEVNSDVYIGRHNIGTAVRILNSGPQEAVTHPEDYGAQASDFDSVLQFSMHQPSADGQKKGHLITLIVKYDMAPEELFALKRNVKNIESRFREQLKDDALVFGFWMDLDFSYNHVRKVAISIQRKLNKVGLRPMVSNCNCVSER